MNTVRLASSEMVFTPGLIAWAMNAYKFPRDQKKMVEIISQSYNLTENCTKALLSGAVEHHVENDVVVFEFDGQAVVS